MMSQSIKTRREMPLLSILLAKMEGEKKKIVVARVRGNEMHPLSIAV